MSKKIKRYENWKEKIQKIVKNEKTLKVRKNQTRWKIPREKFWKIRTNSKSLENIRKF